MNKDQKDPAFLFYTSDFLTGTMFMTDEQVGLYIRLLCAQHQHGGAIYTNVLRTLCDRITNGELVYQKFKVEGEFAYNERLKEEMDKRKIKSVKATESVNKRWEKQKNQEKKDGYERNTNVIRSENENIYVSSELKEGVVGGEKNEPVPEPPKNVLSPTGYFPKAEDVGDLPSAKIEAVKMKLRARNGVSITNEDVGDLWGAFKIQNLTGEKSYRNLNDVHNHFLNTCNTIKINARNQKSRADQQSESLEYLLRTGHASFAASRASRYTG